MPEDCQAEAVLLTEGETDVFFEKKPEAWKYNPE